MIIRALIDFFGTHATKTLGFLQVTLGVVAGSTEVIPPEHLKYYVMALGLATAWRGYFNSGRTRRNRNSF
jgi:hypothetical protein